MATLSVYLFQRFRIQRGGDVLESIDRGKAQELFSYLLLHRERPHLRDTLLDVLWGEAPPARARKALRQALWQVQSALDALGIAPRGGRALVVESGWVQLNVMENLWLDVRAFEQACTFLQGTPADRLDQRRLRILESAVDIYRGDLLDGWYQEWCLRDRDRLRNMYLALLNKLMGHCEVHRDHEKGLAYGERILRHDPAHEGTHRRLMLLHYLDEDRTAALRQYERCSTALREELGVSPSARTVTLYQQIQAGHPAQPAAAPAQRATTRAPATVMPETLDQLQQLRAMLLDIQDRVQDQIRAVELALGSDPG